MLCYASLHMKIDMSQARYIELASISWLTYCHYGVKHCPINQPQPEIYTWIKDYYLLQTIFPFSCRRAWKLVINKKNENVYYYDPEARLFVRGYEVVHKNGIISKKSEYIFLMTSKLHKNCKNIMGGKLCLCMGVSILV